jgi:hypothetical protein
MPNKTLYVKDSDVVLWDLAQDYLGSSVSALFGEFLRERLSMIDTMVHIVRSTPPSQVGEPEFAVMFAPTDSDGARNPRYLSGWEKLNTLLKTVGLTPEVLRDVNSGLDGAGSFSVRANLTLDLAEISSAQYTLYFEPVPVAAGAKSWIKAKLLGIAVTPGSKNWSATYHDLDRCMDVVSNCLAVTAVQLTSIRQSLLEGRGTALGGSRGGIQRFVSRDQLMQMGLAEEE